MKNERENLVEKVDKFAFNIKNLNRIIACLTALFIVFCVVAYTKGIKEYNAEKETYERMLKDMEAYQFNLMYTNTKPNSGEVNNSEIKESPIFNNAIDAACYAFNKLYNYTSFETEGYGQTTAEAAGQQVEILMNFKSARFSNGHDFEELVRKETQTNFGQTQAAQIVYKNGRKYNRQGDNIRKENGKWVADFNSSFSDVTQSVTSRQLYVVNADTIEFSKSFSFARSSNGQIAYYKATIILNPETSTRGYAKNIQEEGGTSYPVFSYVEIACIIDREGNLMSYAVNEKMTLTKKVVVDITTTTTNSITTYIKSHDGNISFAEPQF